MWDPILLAGFRGFFNLQKVQRTWWLVLRVFINLQKWQRNWWLVVWTFFNFQAKEKIGAHLFSAGWSSTHGAEKLLSRIFLHKLPLTIDSLIFGLIQVQELLFRWVFDSEVWSMKIRETARHRQYCIPSSVWLRGNHCVNDSPFPKTLQFPWFNMKLWKFEKNVLVPTELWKLAILDLRF